MVGLFIYLFTYFFIYLFIYLLKAYSPVNRTGSSRGSMNEHTSEQLYRITYFIICIRTMHVASSFSCSSRYCGFLCDRGMFHSVRIHGPDKCQYKFKMQMCSLAKR